MAVLQLTKQLLGQPTPVPCGGIALRHYQGEQDIEPWLALRRAAFARERLGVRDWNRADFEEEFLNRWWWRPERMWLAEAAPAALAQSRFQSSPPVIAGSVTLAMRGEPRCSVPVVHWLAVHPAWRRRGVGSTLMAQIEALAWELQYPQIFLETHDAWTGAAQLYQRLGYLPAANFRTASG